MKHAGINDIPEKIIVGIAPYLEKYDFQNDQFLIHFATGAIVQIDLETFLLKNDLEKFQVNGKNSFARHSSRKNLRPSKLKNLPCLFGLDLSNLYRDRIKFRNF